MRRTCLLVFAATLLGVLPAAAQPQIGGFLEYDIITYFDSGAREQVNGRNQVILQPEIRHEVGPKANLFGAVELRYDQADPSRSRVFLDEAYVNLYAGPVDLRVGRQIYAWGRADGFNPTDFSAWDYSDFLDTDDERLGLVSARATYYAGAWSVEAVLAPSFVPSVLPESDSRWWPELPARVENPAYPQVGLRLLDATYVFADEVLPDEGLRSLQYGVRLAGTRSGWDFSVNWFDGFDDLPALHQTAAVDAAFTAALIRVERRYHRRRTVGADFATTLGPVGLRGEAAYYLTEDWSGTDPAIDDPYLHYVLGTDYTFDDLVAGKDLFLLVEWSKEVRVPDRNTVYRFTDLNHVFRNSIFGKADLRLGAFSTLKLVGVYNIATEDWYVQPGISWSITDGLALAVDVDLLGGAKDSFFGSFSENRRGHLRLKYSF